MQIHDKVAEDLHGILAKKFDSLTLADTSAISTVEPAKGRIFTLEYGSAGKSYGSVTVNIVDPNALVVYYNTNISEDMRYDAKKDWYSFLKELRFFAKRNLMSFDVRNIGKQQLDKQDYAYIKTNDNSYDSNEVQMESKLTGTLKTSYQNFGETRLVIKHTSPVDEEKRGARARHIHSLFIETNGERVKLPFKSLIAGRAFAQHINKGGLFDDVVGQHIQELTQEAYDLQKFVKRFRRADNFAEQEEASKLIQQARERYQGIRETLKTLSGPKGYKSYVAQYQPTEDHIEQADLDEIRSKLIRIEKDNIVDTVLPSLAKGRKAMNVQEGNTELAMALAKDPAAKLEILPNAEDDQEIKDYISHIKQNVIRNKKTSENPSDGIVNKILVSLVKRTADDELSMAMNDLAMKAMAPEGGDMAAKKAAYQIASKYLKGNVEIIEPKAKKKLKGEGEQYEDFMNNLSEGTWSIPDTPEQIDALEKAMAEPLTLGADGENATSTMYGIIGDDELFDDLGMAGENNPEGDARPIIANWVKENLANYQGMPEDLIKRANDIIAKFEGKPATEDAVDEAEVDEAEVEEDNAFNTAAAKAAMAGEKHFTFNGKKYPVKMSKADAEKLLDDVNEMEHPDHEEADAEEIADAIKWRITASPITLDKILKHTDMRSLLDAIDQEAEFHAPMDEIGSSDISAMVNGVMRSLGIKEANEEGTPDIVEQAVQAYKGKNKDNMYEVFKNFAKEDLEAIIKTGHLPEADVEEDMNEQEVKEDDEKLDRDNVKLDMVKPGLETLLSYLKGEQKKYYDERSEIEADLKAKGMNDQEIQKDMQDNDYDFHYYNIDDIEDKIEALENLFKKGDADGNDIVATMYNGPQDTSPREDFMGEIKYAIKKYHEDVYDKLFMYDVNESKNKDKKPIQWPSQPIGEGRLGFKDAEEFGKEMASKIDTELRRKVDSMGKDIRDVEPGKLDQMRFDIAKDMGLVESEKEQTVEQHEIDEILYLAGVK